MGKVLLSGDVSTSDKLSSVSDQAALLWTWLLAHVNSWGQMDGSPGTVRARVVPRRAWSEEEVGDFLGELHTAGLLIMYTLPGNSGKLPELPDTFPGNLKHPNKLLLVTNWEKYQRLDRRAQVPEFPMPTESFRENPGVSGKLPLTRKEVELKGSEQKGTEKKKSIRASGAILWPPDFIKFWNSYPRKAGKGAALKAWAKVQKEGIATETILTALKSQHLETREIQYIPHPATWLNQRRWEDESPKHGGSNGTDPKSSRWTGLAGKDYTEGLDAQGRIELAGSP